MDRRKFIASGLTGILGLASAFGQSQEDYKRWYSNRVANAKSTTPFHHPITNPDNSIRSRDMGEINGFAIEGIKKDFPGKDFKIEKVELSYLGPILGFEDSDIVSEFHTYAFPVIRKVFDGSGVNMPSYSFNTLYPNMPIVQRKEGDIVPFYFIKGGAVKFRGKFHFEVGGKKHSDTIITDFEPLPKGRVVQSQANWTYSPKGYSRENQKLGILVKMNGEDAIIDRVVPAVELLHWQLNSDFEKRMKRKIDDYKRELTENELNFVNNSEHLLHESLVHATAFHVYRDMLDEAGKKAVEKEIQKQVASSVNYRRIPEFMERFKTNSLAQLIKQYREDKLD